MNEIDLTLLFNRLWPRGETLDGQQVFAIVDGARDSRIDSILRSTGLEQTCLFAGPLTAALRKAAPKLVRLSPVSKTTRALFELGWNDNWFVVLTVNADVTLQQLHRHIRTLLRVRDERGGKFLFRFFDPRVLRPYLPSCTPAEARTMFGPISEFCCAGQDRENTLCFSQSRTGVASRTWKPNKALVS